MIGNDSEATLNSLIATTLDSVDGYRKAAENATSDHYRSMFTEFAGERERAVRDLQAEVRALGGNPEDDGTVLAAAHRAFLSLRDAVTGSDDVAIIKEVERGEDHIKAKYEAALDSGKLTGSAEVAVRKAYESVRRGHDRMSALKHSLSGEADGATTGSFGGGATTATSTGYAPTGTTADAPLTGFGSSPGIATGGGAMTRDS